MAPIAGSLLPLDVQRKLRGYMTEEDLLKRCRAAALRELRGSSFSPDDRADCASSLLVEVLTERAAGDLAAVESAAPPRADDRRYSLTVLCGRAANYRRRLQRARAYDQRGAEAEQDRQAWDMAAAMSDAPALPVPITTAEAAALAAALVARLDVADVAGAHDLLARLARDMDGPPYAAEQGVKYATLRQRENRAEKAIRARYPDAAALIRAAVDPEVNPAPRVDPLDGMVTWLCGYIDGSRPAAHATGGRMAPDWRTGTDGGAYPARPDSAERAREVCKLRRVRKLKRRPTEPERVQAEADALRRLGYALARR